MSDWQSAEEGTGAGPWKLLLDNALLTEAVTAASSTVYWMASNCNTATWKEKGLWTHGPTSEQRAVDTVEVFT